MVKRGCWPAGTVVTILTEITSALATAGSASAKATIATVRACNRAACMTRNLSPSKRTALQNQRGGLMVEGDEQRGGASQPGREPIQAAAHSGFATRFFCLVIDSE